VKRVEPSTPRHSRGVEGASSGGKALVAAVLTLLGLLGVLWVGRLDAAGAVKLLFPDLGVARLDQVFLVTSGPRRELRFTTKIINVGQGPIEIAAARMNTRSPFTTWQRVKRAGGGWTQIETPDVRLVYIGSKEHGHWHVRAAARYELVRLDSGRRIKTGVKVGFCYFDDTSYRVSLPGAPKSAVYPKAACGRPADLRIVTGISVGWLDAYYWRIPGQAIDVTGLPTGRYRLSVTADPRNWFRETNERNNATWVEFRLDATSGVSALRHGRAP
jgi:hypothetical protein